MPSSRAATSNSRSRTQVSTAHGPRYAAYVALFDAMTVASKRNAGKRYGPGIIVLMIRVNIAAPIGKPGYAP